MPFVATLLKVIESSVSITSPRFGNTSSLYTHRNLREGRLPLRLNRRRSAAASGQPCTFQNSAVEMRYESVFNAAPIDAYSVVEDLQALRINSALSARESIASIT